MNRQIEELAPARSERIVAALLSRWMLAITAFTVGAVLYFSG